ncbi:MAG TPA: FAD-dependent oxidoreductase [Dongiaceae bacterium]|nr:FAD-dependent oxidoreductase [Dongiaceae bacterium]
MSGMDRADFEEEADVVIVGSGSAALTAALTAAKDGASVLVLEKSEYLGGTSAMSGAATWVPANRHMLEAGIADSPAEALTYLRATAPAGWRETEDELWQAFVENAPQMLDFVEENSPLRFALTYEADPLADHQGGKSGGRTLSPKPISRRVIGRYARKLRRSTLPHIFTYQELSHDIQRRFVSTVIRMAPTLIRRWLTDTCGQGNALMTGLLKGCIDAGCRLETGARVVRLLTDDVGAVTGAAFDQGGRSKRVRARRGLLLATGGFEWDAELFARHFPGPVDFIGSPRTNEGDGQRMAEAVGARLDHMDQANISYLVPTRYEGRLHGIPLQFHTVPNGILVNRHGRRFTSEYRFNLGEVLDARDETGQPKHLPVWFVTDATFFRKSGLLRWFARYDKRWVTTGATVEDLADRIRVPAANLAGTVARFNALAEKGVDEDFHRGETPLEKERAAVSGLMSPIRKAPYCAIPFNRSILGTKGGARTNAAGQVLRPDGSIIPGLYCAGLTMANPIGTRAVGSGTTIGPNMTWGYICAKAMTRANRI